MYEKAVLKMLVFVTNSQCQ